MYTETLDWTTLYSVAKYLVFYTTDPDWGTSSHFRVAADVTATSIAGLDSNTTYYVHVLAYTPLGLLTDDWWDGMTT